MKKTVQKMSLIIGLIITTQANAQISYTSNTLGSATDYVGWDNSNVFPLQIRHNADQEIDTYTNNLIRMKVIGGGGTGTLRETSKKFP